MIPGSLTMDRKMTAMLQIKEIMDDEAIHSDNSDNSLEDSQHMGAAGASKGKDAADGAVGRDRMARGGSVISKDDFGVDKPIFGEPVTGRKRSNSIEANTNSNRPRARPL